MLKDDCNKKWQIIKMYRKVLAFNHVSRSSTLKLGLLINTLKMFFCALENNTFEANPFVTLKERRRLAFLTRLSEAKVQRWFYLERKRRNMTYSKKNSIANHWILKNYFCINPNPGKKEIDLLCDQTSLSKQQVRCFFRNHRYRSKI